MLSQRTLPRLGVCRSSPLSGGFRKHRALLRSGNHSGRDVWLRKLSPHW